MPTDATELAFPAVQTYSSGEEVDWIDPTVEGEAEPERPAPTLRLVAADGGEDAAAAPPVEEDDDGTDTLSIVALVVGVVALVAAAAALVVTRRRGRARPLIDADTRWSPLGATEVPDRKRRPRPDATHRMLGARMADYHVEYAGSALSDARDTGCRPQGANAGPPASVTGGRSVRARV